MFLGFSIFVLCPVDLIVGIYNIYKWWTKLHWEWLFYRKETDQNCPVNFAINVKGKNRVKSHRDQAGNTVWNRCTTKSLCFIVIRISSHLFDREMRRPATGITTQFSNSYTNFIYSWSLVKLLKKKQPFAFLHHKKMSINYFFRTSAKEWDIAEAIINYD